MLLEAPSVKSQALRPPQEPYRHSTLLFLKQVHDCLETCNVPPGDVQSSCQSFRALSLGFSGSEVVRFERFTVKGLGLCG